MKTGKNQLFWKSIFKIIIIAGMAVTIPVSCTRDDDGNSSKTDPSNPDFVDRNAPTITVVLASVDITGIEKIFISGSKLYVSDKLVASWTDDVTKNCKVQLAFDGSSISSGDVASHSGSLTLTVMDDAGNSAYAIISLTMQESFPDLTITKPEVNVFGGVRIKINGNRLLIADEEVASWSDKIAEPCTASLSFNGQEVKDGDILSEAGKLIITITNRQEKSSSAEITLTCGAVISLGYIDVMQVGVTTDLLQGVTLANGAELIKVEIEMDGQRTEIADASHYMPDYPGLCSLIYTVKGKNGDTAEARAENLTIKPLDYRAIEINHIKPVDILPIIGQVEGGDRNVYEHIEHLRIAEATRIRDMMWEYGAGNHSPEEYQKLMSRLNTGMSGETPYGYDNYEQIGERPNPPSYHAHNEWHILNTLIKHANFKVADSWLNLYESLYDLAKNNENNINIFGNSTSSENNRTNYLMDESKNNSLKKLIKLKNFIFFGAGTNIKRPNDLLKNKIYQEDVTTNDEHGIYGFPSGTNGKNDSNIDRHLIVTIGTDSEGDIDQTNETTGSSKYPVGFHNKVLFSGRTFPYLSLAYNKIKGDDGKYPTSYPNYVNVAIASLCFQMFAEVKDVDELLEMIRSTGLTDYIRFDLNGDGDTDDTIDGQPESQPLILMNPAGFFQKYLMPTTASLSVKQGEATTLKKGYYHGVVFDIPGAEVNINGEWISFTDNNKDLILAQNPMTLQWRINADLLRKLGYKQGDTVKGYILVVDDQWQGLTITTDISVKVE